MKTTATIYDDSDTRIEIIGEFFPGMKGRRDEFGVPLEPDDEPDMEILDAVDQYGTTRNLSKDEESAAMEALWESLH